VRPHLPLLENRGKTLVFAEPKKKNHNPEKPKRRDLGKEEKKKKTPGGSRSPQENPKVGDEGVGVWGLGTWGWPTGPQTKCGGGAKTQAPDVKINKNCGPTGLEKTGGNNRQLGPPLEIQSRKAPETPWDRAVGFLGTKRPGIHWIDFESEPEGKLVFW